MSNRGLDWEKIRADYVAKASPSELPIVKTLKDGSEVLIPRVDPEATPPTNGNGTNGRVRSNRSWREYGDGSASSIPRSRILTMYSQDRMTVAEIAEFFGVHKSGIYKHLAAAADRGQVELRDDRYGNTGRPKRTKCGRNEHSMVDGDPNVRIDRNGARHCRACEARRAAERKATPKQQSSR